MAGAVTGSAVRPHGPTAEHYARMNEELRRHRIVPTSAVNPGRGSTPHDVEWTVLCACGLFPEGSLAEWEAHASSEVIGSAWHRQWMRDVAAKATVDTLNAVDPGPAVEAARAELVDVLSNLALRAEDDRTARWLAAAAQSVAGRPHDPPAEG